MKIMVFSGPEWLYGSRNLKVIELQRALDRPIFFPTAKFWKPGFGIYDHIFLYTRKSKSELDAVIAQSRDLMGDAEALGLVLPVGSGRSLGADLVQKIADNLSAKIVEFYVPVGTSWATSVRDYVLSAFDLKVLCAPSALRPSSALNTIENNLRKNLVSSAFSEACRGRAVGPIKNMEDKLFNELIGNISIDFQCDLTKIMDELDFIANKIMNRALCLPMNSDESRKPVMPANGVGVGLRPE
jgi:hypothetical protein